MVRSNTLTILEEISSYSKLDVGVRGLNACEAALKFIDLLNSEIEDEEEQKRLLNAWFKAVRNSDPSKFEKAFRKFRRNNSSK